MKAQFLVLLFVLMQNLTWCKEKQTQLVLVEIMFRHGVRSWIGNFPNEPIDPSIWDKYGGYGQLTTAGVKQMTQFGDYFKKYYEKDIDFEQENVYVKSTNKSRTILSAKSFLSGLFGDNSIPISVNKFKLDDVLNFDFGICPRYEQLQKEFKNTSEYIAINKTYGEFIEKMSNFSGIKSLDYYDMWKIADHVLGNQANNLPLTEWELDNYVNITQATDYTSYVEAVYMEMGKIISGGLLKAIISNIKNKILDKTANKLFIYAIHDYYITAMERLLGTSDTFVNPNFGSAFIFELRMDKRRNYFVRVLSKNTIYPGAIRFDPVKIEGCEELCPIEKFLKLTSDKFVDDFGTACQAKS